MGRGARYCFLRPICSITAAISRSSRAISSSNSRAPRISTAAPIRAANSPNSGAPRGGRERALEPGDDRGRRALRRRDASPQRLGESTPLSLKVGTSANEARRVLP